MELKMTTSLKSNCITLFVLLISFISNGCSTIQENRVNWYGYESDHIYYINSPDYSFFTTVKTYDSYRLHLKEYEEKMSKYPYDKKWAYSIIEIQKESIYTEVSNSNDELYFSETFYYKNNLIQKIELNCLQWKFLANYSYEGSKIYEKVTFYSPSGKLIYERLFDSSDDHKNKIILNRHYTPGHKEYFDRFNQAVDDYCKRSGFKEPLLFVIKF